MSAESGSPKLSIAFVIFAATVGVYLGVYIAGKSFLPTPGIYLWTLWNPGDSNSLYALINQYSHTLRPLIKDPYTHTSHQPFIFNPVFYLLGLVARIIGLPVWFCYRAIFGALVAGSLSAISWLLAGEVMSERERRWGWWLALWGGGIGWMMAAQPTVGFRRAFSFYDAEPGLYMSLFASHRAFSALTWLASWYALLKWEEKKTWGLELWMIMVMLWLGQASYPYFLPISFFWAGLYLLLRWRELGRKIWLALLAVSSPTAINGLYLAWVKYYASPLGLGEEAGYGIVPSRMLLGGYGLLALGIIGGYLVNIRLGKHERWMDWAISLAGASVICVFLPDPTPARSWQTLTPLMGIIGAVGWRRLWRNKPAWWVVVMVLSLSGLLRLPLTFCYVWAEERYKPNFYLNEPRQELVRWVEEYVPAGAPLLTTYFIGNLIPACTSHPVWLGHPFLTPCFWQRSWALQGYLSGDKKFVGLGREIKRDGISYWVGLWEEVQGGRLPTEWRVIKKNPEGFLARYHKDDSE